MRVIAPISEHARLPEAILYLLERGVYQRVNGDLVEPMEVFRDQDAAMVDAQKRHAATGQVHKVVMSADPEDLA